MLNINGIDLEFDLFDADFAEKYQKAMDKVQNKEKNYKDTGNLAKTIRFECNLIFDFVQLSPNLFFVSCPYHF